MVERVALAVAKVVWGPRFDPHLNPEAFDHSEQIARAAIAALTPAEQFPERGKSGGGT